MGGLTEAHVSTSDLPCCTHIGRGLTEAHVSTSDFPCCTHIGIYTHEVPLHKPTKWEKKMLIWSGRFKKEDEIPETIS
ncbi:hypothetical protein P7K49_031037 [Saguinus oedipus]|uniref:Protein FAM162A n=1 Tax=Saguinus oedipus TaxID=9490 RepID=A0ABQ9U3V8_SAGOE|nr:hypothetical protein P7K49_031037 [Saguinus oedipus]